MKIQNPALKFVLVLILLIACILASLVIKDVQRSAWTQNAERNVKGTAILIQTYQKENGSLPKTLAPIFENRNFPTAGDLKAILGCSESHYDYQELTNGFIIAVVRNAGFLHPEWKVSQSFSLSK